MISLHHSALFNILHKAVNCSLPFRSNYILNIIFLQILTNVVLISKTACFKFISCCLAFCQKGWNVSIIVKMYIGANQMNLVSEYRWVLLYGNIYLLLDSKVYVVIEGFF